MENLIIGFLAGLVIFGLLWQFVLKNKGDENKVDDTELKINLATKEAELKAAETAKQDLTHQLEEKKDEVKDLYIKVDGVADGVKEYKSISDKALHKHDEAIARHSNWWDSLTTNITYQGKFNQQILENLLTNANLVKDRDFFVQKKQTTYDVDENKDKDVLPDVILKFPERNYVVDAKVSLTDWTKYVEAARLAARSDKEEDKKLAAKYLKDHIASVRKHLFGPKGLDKKNYNKLYGMNSLQSVIVFFPADPLYTITLDRDKSLQNDALKKGFIFSSPNNLNNLIAVFEQIKSEKKQIENISKIITSASKIFDKYSDIKTAVKGALQSYRTHATNLQSIVTKSWGSQGLEKQINKLKEDHGVIPGKQIPEIPAEQTVVSDIDDPEDSEKDQLN